MKENKFYVYVHISKENDIPFYIGFGQKYRISCKSKRSLEWNKIAINGFYYGKIKDNMSREEANLFEKYCISIFKKIGFNLVNKINGGSGNSKRKSYSEEYKKILSLRGKEYWKNITDEKRKEISKTLSEKLKGKKKSKRSNIHLKNQSLSHMGQIPWNKGRENIYSDETKQKMGEKLRKKVYLYKDDILVGEFKSLSEASKILNIPISNISKFLNGKSRKIKNCEFTFKYETV